MKVLLVHNTYQQAGGEDQAFAAEANLLEANGHQVLRYLASNVQVHRLNAMALAQTAIWSTSAYREMRAFLTRERPQVVHVHNTLPLISPSVYHAARAEGVAVVQTLHNYRLLCPNGLLFRDGGVCEDCMGKFVPWPGVAHACYRGSRPATATVAAMLTVHRGLGTWTRVVDVFIAPTEFARHKFIAGGLPAEKIVVKPNFISPDPGADGPGAGEQRGEHALFVGRLSAEKGVDTLLAAWECLGRRVPLKIVGDGPYAKKVSDAARRLHGIEWLGEQSHDAVLRLMRQARFLVFPSLCYETFGLVIAEAYGVGLPVIASDLGSMSSLVAHGHTGLHFRAGDPAALVEQVDWALANPERLADMGRNARQEYVAHFTADRNYQILMQAYAAAIERARGVAGR